MSQQRGSTMALVKSDGLESFAIAFKATVIRVDRKSKKHWTGGIGADATFMDIDQGWFITLDGSHESLFAGAERPNVKIGDMAVVRVSFYGR